MIEDNNAELLKILQVCQVIEKKIKNVNYCEKKTFCFIFFFNFFNLENMFDVHYPQLYYKNVFAEFFAQ